jgi:hypothetical protein
LDDGNMAREQTLRFILEQVPEDFPDATVSFLSVELFSYENINSLPPGMLSRLRELELAELEAYICRKYRDFGDIDDEVPDAEFNAQCMEIRKVLEHKYNVHHAKNKKMRDLIRGVIHFHFDCRNAGQSFEEYMDKLPYEFVESRGTNSEE